MPSVAVPNPVPPPLAITEAEAVTFLRTVARMHGGFAVRLYRGGFKSPPERSREVIGYAVAAATFMLPWNDRPTWVYDKATGLLLAQHTARSHAVRIVAQHRRSGRAMTAPVRLSEREAIDTLRVIAAMHGGHVNSLILWRPADADPAHDMGLFVLATLDRDAPQWVWLRETGELLQRALADERKG